MQLFLFSSDFKLRTLYCKVLDSKVTNKSCLKLLFKNRTEEKCLDARLMSEVKPENRKKKEMVRPGVIFAFSQQFAAVLQLEGLSRLSACQPASRPG